MTASTASSPSPSSPVDVGVSSATKLAGLEERSKSTNNSPNAINVSLKDDEAIKISLISLIGRMEWRHTMNKIEASPKEARVRQTIVLEGHETKGHALHLAVSKKPPVSTDYDGGGAHRPSVTTVLCGDSRAF